MKLSSATRAKGAATTSTTTMAAAAAMVVALMATLLRPVDAYAFPQLLPHTSASSLSLPSPSSTLAAPSGPITAAPVVPWRNFTGPVVGVSQPMPSCLICPSQGYSSASACSRSQRDYDDAVATWSDQHYTTTTSLLPPGEYKTFTRWQQQVPRGQSPGCIRDSPYYLVTNQINVTLVRPEFEAEYKAAMKTDYDYGPSFVRPDCAINTADCMSLWAVHETDPVRQPEPTCSTAGLGICNPAYVQPVAGPISAPTYSWIVVTPTPSRAPHSFGRRPHLEVSVTSDPGPVQTPSHPHWTPIDQPANKWSPHSDVVAPPPPASSSSVIPPPQLQPQPTSHTSSEPAELGGPRQARVGADTPDASLTTDSAADAAPLTVTTVVGSSSITATVFPAVTHDSTTISPSVVISGATLVPSGTTAVVAGMTLSAAGPSADLVSVTESTTVAAFPAGSAPPVTTELITIDGRTYTATYSTSVVVLAPGLTATIGGPALTIPHVEATSTDAPVPASGTGLSSSGDSAPSNQSAGSGVSVSSNQSSGSGDSVSSNQSSGSGDPASSNQSPASSSGQDFVVSAGPGGALAILTESTVLSVPTGVAESAAAPAPQQTGSSDSDTDSSDGDGTGLSWSLPAGGAPGSTSDPDGSPDGASAGGVDGGNGSGQSQAANTPLADSPDKSPAAGTGGDSGEAGPPGSTNAAGSSRSSLSLVLAAAVAVTLAASI